MTLVGVAGGGPAQGARRPDSMEDGGLGRDRTRRHAGSLTRQDPPTKWILNNLR